MSPWSTGRLKAFLRQAQGAGRVQADAAPQWAAAMSQLDPRSLLLATGLLYIAMPLAVLLILWQRHPRLRVIGWVASGLCLGVTAVLYSLREIAPAWLTVALANVVSYAAFFAKLPVLRLEQGLPARWQPALALWLLASLAFVAAFASGQPVGMRSTINACAHIGGALLVARQAHLLARQTDSRSAQMIALVYLLYAGTVLLRMSRRELGLNDGLPVSPQFDYLLLLLAALLAALLGNVGYLGMALERTRVREQAQRQALDRLREQQQALDASRHARDAVRSERYRSSQVLAHEVRQPLHNAAVALQAATSRLQALGDAQDAVRAVMQAQAVIQRVSASLDNTVAAASLLTSDVRVSRQAVELDVIIDLCVADLAPAARARVVVDNQAEGRSAYMEPGLVRLAVRNLLINATRYAPEGTQVTLRLLDSESPLALVIEVADLGPGLPPARESQVNTDSPQGPPSVLPGQGLGLHIVRRVADMHGGSLRWRANTPQGSVFTLTLPQADLD